jgi:glucokinase
MPKTCTIGIDVGGTKTLVALFDKQFKVLEETKIRTPGADRDKFTAFLNETVAAFDKKARKLQLKLAAIGVGFAGLVDSEKNIVRSAPNLPAMESFSPQTAFADMEDIQFALANDANAGLYGEYRLGAAQGYKHVIGVFVGTGIGGAIIIDGKLYTGATGMAGDIGHYLLQPLAPLAGSEQQGTLDDFSSRTAIAGEAATLALKNWAPNLLRNAGTDVKNIKASSLAEAIQLGDEKLEELVRSRCHTIGIALSNIVDFLNPEMIVLGGGLTEALPSIIRKEVQSAIEAHATEAARSGLKVVTAKLGDHAVAAGAAKLALDSARGSAK